MNKHTYLITPLSFRGPYFQTSMKEFKYKEIQHLLFMKKKGAEMHP